MRQHESLLNFITPVEIIVGTNALTCPAPVGQQYRFKYPYLKVMEVSNASQVLLSGPAAGNAYRRLGGRGVALSIGQILLVQPGEVYELGCRLQLGDQLVLWNHPDLNFLAQMNAGAIAPIVRVLNQVIPGGGSVMHYLWVDPKVFAIEAHFYLGAGPGSAVDIYMDSMTEELDYSLSPAPIVPINIWSVLGVPQNSERGIGLNKCSTVLPAVFANVAQSRVFGRWIRFTFAEGNLADATLSQINIKLDQH